MNHCAGWEWICWLFSVSSPDRFPTLSPLKNSLEGWPLLRIPLRLPCSLTFGWVRPMRGPSRRFETQSRKVFKPLKKKKKKGVSYSWPQQLLWSYGVKSRGDSSLLISCLNAVKIPFIKLVFNSDGATISCWDTDWYKEHTGTKMRRSSSDRLDQRSSDSACIKLFF